MEQKVFVGIAACGCIHAAWIDRADDDQSDIVAEMIRSGLRVVYRPLGDGVRLNGNCGHNGIAPTSTADAQEALRAENTRLREELKTAKYEASVYRGMVDLWSAKMREMFPDESIPYPDQIAKLRADAGLQTLKEK